MNAVPPRSTAPRARLKRTAPLALSLAAGLCAASDARAGWPEDVTLSQLDSYDGEAFNNNDEIAAAWREVARDIATGIANKPVGASTLGLDGFDVGLGTTLTFVDGHRKGGGPTAWERVREGYQGSGALFVPGVHLRKGLPLSFEVGGSLGWMAWTRQGVLAGYGRFAPLEGHRKLPDVAVQVGRAGYIGNDELSVATTDAQAIVGKKIAFASGRESRTNTFEPYGAFGSTWSRATPRLPADRLDDLGIGTLSADKSDTETFDSAMRQLEASLGFRLVSGDAAFRATATAPFGGVPSLETSFGYVF